jgi:hypothetical protein
MISSCLFVFPARSPWRRARTTRFCENCHAEPSRLPRRSFTAKAGGISGFFLRHTKRFTPSIQRLTLTLSVNAQCSLQKSAGGGARTHTALRPLDFESSASANSATPALREIETTNSTAKLKRFRRVTALPCEAWHSWQRQTGFASPPAIMLQHRVDHA